MPTGVEHQKQLTQMADALGKLIAASMPTGVEHITFVDTNKTRRKRLIAASMPTGVEHSDKDLRQVILATA